MLIPIAAAKMRHSLTLLEQWRNDTRQMLIDSLDQDAYAVPDALTTLNEAHEQAKGIIARYLFGEHQRTQFLIDHMHDSVDPDKDDPTGKPVA